MESILVATDGSTGAGAALRFAIALARDGDAELHVVSVRPRAFQDRIGSLRPLEPGEQVHGARIIADEAASDARAEGVHASSHEASGDAAEAIAALAVELDVDLVVVGSRGLGTIGAALLGSVSRALVAYCQRPVTVVRAGHVHRLPAV